MAVPAARVSAPPQRADTKMNVTKRLQSELMGLMMSGTKDLTAFPDGDNLFKWSASIKGAVGTVYDGLCYKLKIEFSSEYPYKAPSVRFETPCFHPNVDQTGYICLDILKENWSAVYNVQTILLSIQSLLGEPNPDSPLNTQAAALWANQEEYKKVLLKKYAEDSKSNATASSK